MSSFAVLNHYQIGPGRFLGGALSQFEPIERAESLGNRIEVIPDKSGRVLGALSTYEHRLSVPPGSLLAALSGSSEQAEGFTVQVTDAGAQGATLFSQPVQLANATAQGYAAGITNGAGVLQQPAQPLAFMGRPRVIVEPGRLKVTLVNLANASNRVQLCLWFVTPPAAGEPVNEWNGLLDSEAALARLARRGATAQASAGTNADGTPWTGATDPLDLPATPVSFDITATGAGTLPIINGAAGFRIAIYALDAQVVEANQLTLMNGAKALRGQLTLSENQGYMRQSAPPKQPHWVLDEGAGFGIAVANAGRLTGDLQFRMLESWGV